MRRRNDEGLSAFLKPFTGYSQRVLDALMVAFPEWKPFVQAVPGHYDAAETAFIITVPDPVAGRDQPLRLSTEWAGKEAEVIVYFGRRGTHAHYGWRTENEAKHFAGLCAFLKNFLDEQSVYWEDYRGEKASGGGHAPLDKAEQFMQSQTAGTNPATERRMYSWHGTHDRKITFETQNANHE